MGLTPSVWRILFLLPVCALLPWRAAQAQFETTGAPFVPTLQGVIDHMLNLAAVNANDYLIDLGSGDGRVVIEAATKRGARGLGVEIDVNLVFAANEEARRRGLASRVLFVRADLFKADISKASVLTLYLSRPMNLQLRPRLLTELRPGTRVVAHDFDMGAWKPDMRLEIAIPDKPYGLPVSQIYLWHVPAEVAGKWRWELTVGGKRRVYEARVDQTFQEISGEMMVDGGGATSRNLKLRGDLLDFTLVHELSGQLITHEFSGRVEGERAVGRVRISGGGEIATADWIAARVERGKMRFE